MSQDRPEYRDRKGAGSSPIEGGNRTVAQISDSQIRALIRLLTDEDERIVQRITCQLVQVGDPATSLLHEAQLERPELAMRIAWVLDEIRGRHIEQGFGDLAACHEEPVDLERGAFLIARYAYPDLDEIEYQRELDTMAGTVRERIGRRASGEETVKTLGRYLFTELGFRGNTKNYYDADNNYLNRVIDRRTGIPISLSVVYLLVARRLGLPVIGIGMPGHFLVKFESERYKVFIDCFNSGTLLTERDCVRFLTQAGYGFEQRYLDGSTSRAILIRSLRNLVPIYHKLDDTIREERLSRFIQILECGGSHSA